MKIIWITLLLVVSAWASATHSAKVLEKLESGGYSYIKVKEADKSYWIAMTQRPINIGDKIDFNEQGWMSDFYSKTLDRRFDKILFASDASFQTQKKVVKKPNIMSSSYQKGKSVSIAQLFARPQLYVGTKVRVRAKVTKVSKGIMKRNWVHLQDGSRYNNMDDLVFTTTGAVPKVGATVLAEGTLIRDKDFGYGYFYPVIIEESTFTTTK